MAKKKSEPKKAPRWIEYMPVAELHSATRNPKKHSDDLGASIERFGYADAVILDERTSRLVAGHGRMGQIIALKEEGAEPPGGVVIKDGVWMIPVQRGWESKDDAEADAFLLAHNKVGEAGGWDWEELKPMLTELVDAKKAIGLGWEEYELAPLASDWKPETPGWGSNPGDSGKGKIKALHLSVEERSLVDTVVDLVRAREWVPSSNKRGSCVAIALLEWLETQSRKPEGKDEDLAKKAAAHKAAIDKEATGK